MKTILVEINSLRTEMKQSKARIDVSALQERASHLLSRIDTDRQNGNTERAVSFRNEYSILSRLIDNFVPINSQESFAVQNLEKIYLQTILKLLQDLENSEKEDMNVTANDDDIPF